MKKELQKLKEINEKAEKSVLASNEKIDSINKEIEQKIDDIETLQSVGNNTAILRDNEILNLSKEKQEDFNTFTRKWGQFVRSRGEELFIKDANYIYSFLDFLSKNEEQPKKYKVAMLFICLNQPYWEFAKEAIQGAKRFFLPGHETDYFLWSDIPTKDTPTEIRLEPEAAKRAIESVNYIHDEKITVFPTEPVDWPYPTLMRYHLFLQQEWKLKDYDYVFYCDVDMLWNDIVGDEILGEKLTVARHPMYALRQGLTPPTEPNPESSAYIKKEGIIENNKFNPVYGAGGFQGGTTEYFIKSMKEMRQKVDEDSARNYIAIWNDESHWNKYLFEHPEEISVILSPSYVYPDSLIDEYYTKVWGRNYHPRLITLTKKFTTSKEAGAVINEQMKTW